MGESFHCVVENHGDSIIEETLTKHQEVQADVDVDLFEDGEDSHRIN